MPTGAEWADEWDGEGDDRGRFFSHPGIAIADVTLSIRGVQYADGGTGRSLLLQLDSSVRDTGADFTPLYARRLAAMLQNYADSGETRTKHAMTPMATERTTGG